MTARSVIEALTIVPEAHVRMLDVPLQWRLYEVFHLHPASRAGHLLMTPLVVAGTVALGARVGPAPLDGGTVLAVGLALLYARVDLRAAAILAVALAAIRAAVLLVDPSPLAACALVAVASAVQAASHVVEPMPPPWTGSSRFVPMVEFLRTATLRRLLAIPVLLVTGPLLEAWASPRIWPYQVLSLLSALGHRRDERARYVAECPSVLEDCRVLWRSSA